MVLTHLHADHSGAACHPDGTPRFPNARYHVHPEDWSFFATHRTPDDFTGRFAMAGLEALGALDLDPTDHEIVPGLSVHHAPGHTPGHRVVELSDAGGTLLLIGDLLHTPPQVAHPTGLSNHDEDPELAAEHRRRWMDRAEQDDGRSASGTSVVPSDGSSPTAGGRPTYHARVASARVRTEERAPGSGRPRITPPSLRKDPRPCRVVS